MNSSFASGIGNILRMMTDRSARQRRRLARTYLSGRGLEIGALHNPLKVPPQTHVTYVDRMKEEELRKQYPELSDKPLVPVTIVDDGETLSTITDESMDFVIANHMIEHSENPLLALQNWLRVLKKDGILYLAVPNKHKTFDSDRPATPIDHLVRDYKEGPLVSRVQHFEEWVRLVGKTGPEKVDAEVERLMTMQYSIHYHVWDPPSFLDLLRFCIVQLSYPLRVECSVITGNEVIVILKKTA